MTKLILLAAVLASPVDPGKQAVICAETGFSLAAESRNMDAFLTFIDPDARFVGASVARGKAEIGQAWSVYFAPGGPVIRWRPAVVEVSADGSLALSRGPYRITVTDEEGGVRYSWGRFVSTWRRTLAGTRQVIFDSGGDHGMTPGDEEIAVLLSEPDCGSAAG